MTIMTFLLPDSCDRHTAAAGVVRRHPGGGSRPYHHRRRHPDWRTLQEKPPSCHTPAAAPDAAAESPLPANAQFRSSVSWIQLSGCLLTYISPVPLPWDSTVSLTA